MLGTKLLTPVQGATGAVLGPLAALPGTWIGSGFSVIPHPDLGGDQPLRLDLRETQESLTFTHVQSSVPRQLAAGPADKLVGIHYLQRLNDAATGEALHVEPGMWLTVASTTEPTEADPTVVRLACLPQSDALLSHGTASTTAGAPIFPVEDTSPLHPGTHLPVTEHRYLLPFALQQRAAEAAGRFDAEDARDPNRLLRAAIERQRIVRCTAISVDTESTGPAAQEELRSVPAAAKCGRPISLRATLWIEEVERPFDAGTFLQLQYSQRVVVRLNDVDWPHVSVATLQKL